MATSCNHKVLVFSKKNFDRKFNEMDMSKICSSCRTFVKSVLSKKIENVRSKNQKEKKKSYIRRHDEKHSNEYDDPEKEHDVNDELQKIYEQKENIWFLNDLRFNYIVDFWTYHSCHISVKIDHIYNILCDLIYEFGDCRKHQYTLTEQVLSDYIWNKYQINVLSG